MPKTLALRPIKAITFIALAIALSWTPGNVRHTVIQAIILFVVLVFFDQAAFTEGYIRGEADANRKEKNV